jgi:chromosome segregation ATPase
MGENELREQLEDLETTHSSMVSARDLTIAHLRSQLATVTKEMDESREAIVAANLELEDSVGLQRKLATAVEALELSAEGCENCYEHAQNALFAIRAQEEKKGYTVDDSPETMARVKERFGMSPPCTCPRGERIGMLGVDPNCPKHGAK